MAAGLGLVTLNAEIGIHRVIANQGAEEVIRPRIDRHQIAHLDPPLRARLAAERRNQRNPARAGDLHVLLVGIERRYRNARQRPDVVEVDLARQHVEQRLVGRRLGGCDDQLLLVARRGAEAGLARVGIAGDAEGILIGRDRGHAGEERRADRQEVARCLKGLRTHLVLGIDPHPVAPHRERGRNLVHELADAGLPALGIDDGLGEQPRLARRALRDAMFEPGAHRVQGPRARDIAARPGELAQDALEEIILEHRVERHIRRAFPPRGGRLPLGKGEAQGTVGPALDEIAHRRMGGRKRIFRAVNKLVDHADCCGLLSGDAAPAKNQVERIAHALRAPPVEQQARQALGAAIAGEQAQPDLRLAEARHGLGHAVMAGERELHAPAQGHPLHRRDAGLAHALDGAEGEVRIVGEDHGLLDRVDLLQHLADVRPRHEGRGALAGEDHRDHRIVTGQRRGDQHQLVDGALVERIDRRVGDSDRRHLLARRNHVVLHEEIAVPVEQRLLVRQTLPALPFGDDLAQFVKRLGVAQRRDVADILAHHQRADHAAHILARARLGELRDLDEIRRHRHRALLGAHQIEQAALVLVGELATRDRHHEGERGQPLLAVRRANHQHVADGRVRRQRLVAQHRALDLLGPHAVARDVDHVVRAAVEREGAVRVLDREIALGIGPGALPAPPVAFLPTRRIAAPGGIDAAVLDLEAGDVAPDRAREIGIRRGDHDLALLADIGLAPRHAAVFRAREGSMRARAFIVLDPHIADDPRQRIGVGIGTQREILVAEHMRPRDPTVLGRPVGVDVAGGDVLHPEGLHAGADRLGAEGRHPQPAHVVAFELGKVRRVRHDRLQESHARLENADIVPLDHRGKAPRVGEDRRAFGNERGHPRHQRRADEVALPGDPARIGDHEQRVPGARVEARLHRFGHACGIAVAVDDPLGLARAARGVDEEHRVVGIDRHGLGGSPYRADEIAVRQRHQLGFRLDSEACGPRLLQHRAERRLGQRVAPAVALLAPDHVGLVRVPAHDHRLHARRQGHEARGDGDPHTGRIGAGDPPLAPEIDERLAHAAHHVGTIDRDLPGQRLAHRLEDRRVATFGQAELEPAEDLERRRHRHEIVERRVGIGVLERGDLGVPVGTVRGNDHPRAGVGDAVREGLVGEPAEHRRIDHAHALGRLGPVDLRHDARHVERHPVARFQAQRFQRHRALRHFQQQALAADREAIDRRALAAARAHVPAVALEDQRRFGPVPGEHMAIEFGEGGIGPAADKPAPVRRVGTVKPGVPR